MIRVFALLLAPVALMQDKGIEEYFPLALGNKWTYVVKDKEGEEREVVVEVTEILKSEPPQYVIPRFPFNPEEPYEAHFAQDKDGVHLCGGKKIVREDALFIKSPLKKGDEWEWKDVDGLVIKCRHEGEDEVEVPAGKFKCWKVVQETVVERQKAVLTIWLAPGAGIAKMSWNFPEVTATLELKKFEKK